jgi:type I restriction enzyme S subunit
VTFPTCALGDLIELHDDRRVPLSAAQRANRQGQFPYYGAQGVIDSIDDYRFDGTFLLVPEDGENLRSRKLPVAFIAEGRFWVNNHAHVVKAEPGRADLMFLKYAVEATNISPWITGAAQPKLSQANLCAIEVPCPPLDVQVRISDVLGAFDRLVDNNRRRIAKLDQSAQSLYNEWFVRLRFPGHQAVKLAESRDGAIPPDWTPTRLGNALTLVMGQSPSSAHYNESAEGLPFHQGVGSYGRRYPRHRRWTREWSREAEPGDVLVSVRAPVGRLNIADCKLALGRGIAAARPADGMRGYWFHALRHVFRSEDTFGGGTIFKSVTRDDLARIEHVVPDESLRRRFDEAVVAMADLDLTLDRQEGVLRTARDLLLQRLVRGTLSIDSLDVADVFGWAQESAARAITHAS